MIVKVYKDLCLERKICMLNINSLEAIIKNFKLKMIKPPSGYKPIGYDGMPHGNSAVYEFDVVVDKYNQYIKELEEEKELLEILNENIEKEKFLMKNLQGLEFKIMYDRLILGNSFKEIAETYDMKENTVIKMYGRLMK